MALVRCTYRKTQQTRGVRGADSEALGLALVFGGWCTATIPMPELTAYAAGDSAG